MARSGHLLVGEAAGYKGSRREDTMIQRFVLVKLKEDYANRQIREELAARSREILPSVPGVLGVSVGVPADEATEGAWDLSLIIELTSLAQIPAYLAHPLHRDYVDNLLKPKMEVLKAWNFEAERTEK
jgi:hypothetical protein